MTYGEEIRKGREKQHLTQEDLAERLGVSRQAVSKWEADKSRPAAAKLAALSEALDIPEEIWAAIDAENRAVPPEPVLSSRRWKIITAALAVLLLLSLLGSATLFWELRQQNKDVVPAQEEPVEIPLTEPSDISQVFPETLVLEYERDYDFGDKPIGTYDPALVPFLDGRVYQCTGAGRFQNQRGSWCGRHLQFLHLLAPGQHSLYDGVCGRLRPGRGGV